MVIKNVEDVVVDLLVIGKVNEVELEGVGILFDLIFRKKKKKKRKYEYCD